ncbi:MAG: hypothetical protein ACJAZ0_000752, partial [Halioglobus sp.]
MGNSFAFNTVSRIICGCGSALKLSEQCAVLGL